MVSIAVVSKNLVKVATRRFVFSLFGVGEVLIGDLARVLSFAELSLHDLTFNTRQNGQACQATASTIFVC